MSVETTYRAKNLAALAADFDERAAYCWRLANGGVADRLITKAQADIYMAQAGIWDHAASILRRTTLEEL